MTTTSMPDASADRTLPKSILGKLADRVSGLPAALQVPILTAVSRRAVPFIGTAGVKVLSMGPEGVRLSLANRRRVHNHIQGVHAAAAALLAETASGFALGVVLTADKLPLLVRMEVDYVRRMSGSLVAEATLPPGTLERVAQDPKGEVTIDVQITDEAGEEPVVAKMIWAWRSKRK